MPYEAPKESRHLMDCLQKDDAWDDNNNYDEDENGDAGNERYEHPTSVIYSFIHSYIHSLNQSRQSRLS